MKLLVDVAMAAVVAVIGIDVALMIVGTFDGDSSVIFDFLEMDQVDLALPVWVSAIIILTALSTVASLGCVFWPLSKIIRLKDLQFATVGSLLRKSAHAGIGFWIGSTLLFFLYPLLIHWILLPDVESMGFFPLGFETIFLVMSLTFMTIGKTLEHAKAVEDENSQFL